MRKIAVFDTNILFSGVGWKGKPFLCLELARAGVVDGVTCRELLDELAEKLQSKLSFTPEQTLDTVADLLTFLRVVPITGKLKAIPADPDDDKVLEWNAQRRLGQHISSQETAGTCCLWGLFRGSPF